MAVLESSELEAEVGKLPGWEVREGARVEMPAKDSAAPGMGGDGTRRKGGGRRKGGDATGKRNHLKAGGIEIDRERFEVTVGGRNYRLDLAYRAERIFIEGDGFGVHSPRTAFESDRTRQNKLVHFEPNVGQRAGVTCEVSITSAAPHWLRGDLVDRRVRIPVTAAPA
jgi:hypothetical protein